MKFLTFIFAASFALIGSTYLELIAPPPSFNILITAFLAITTLGAYYLVDTRRKSGAMNFTLVYLITVVAKVLVYGIFVVIIILADKPGATSNAIFFLVGYFLFTAIEVTFLYIGTLRQ